ncbi:hypothetical protein L195_g051316 [Trifolium pratense]|uniref:Uncharacterized protein n=1 Tax=Trifolium pratense TaxID=57577 RepID=A0A2K3JZ06_TRIPR|nr:hypothetical protein L195_g051316 [Trifolium pratense]
MERGRLREMDGEADGERRMEGVKWRETNGDRRMERVGWRDADGERLMERVGRRPEILEDVIKQRKTRSNVSVISISTYFGVRWMERGGWREIDGERN